MTTTRGLRTRRLALATTLLGLLVAAGCGTTLTGGDATGDPTSPASGSAAPGSATPSPSGSASGVPAITHVFVINIENKDYDATWGSTSRAPYLARTLRSQGVLLENYYGTAHNSQPNYVAQISGQGPNPQMQSDCKTYSTFVQKGTSSLGQVVGEGCVFPASVPHLPGQLQAKGLTWKGYMEDMGTPCRHPVIDTTDTMQRARVGDQYVVRHNPFMYFSSITDAADCGEHVVDLNRLATDLSSASMTPNLAYISPNLCHDGHDSPCVDGEPGGLTSVNGWLQTWVPKILASPAYKDQGMLVITADESESPRSDSSACCGEGPGPNAPLPGINGLGGGRIGALILSPFVSPGTTSSTPYNHYSLLASIEDVFGLAHLGYAAAPGLSRFGADVYNR
ncbi:MAG TPA: alkaline phosphatase family protein [Propionibacteriaceae bacterium]|nr:alkaline phosphatase family protein [Propionibacteriaceae bacterium]